MLWMFWISTWCDCAREAATACGLLLLKRLLLAIMTARNGTAAADLDLDRDLDLVPGAGTGAAKMPKGRKIGHQFYCVLSAWPARQPYSFLFSYFLFWNILQLQLQALLPARAYTFSHTHTHTDTQTQHKQRIAAVRLRRHFTIIPISYPRFHYMDA